MIKNRRTYSREFKLEALRLWQTTDKSGAEIERELGIGPGCFSRWKQKYLRESERAFPAESQGRLGCYRFRGGGHGRLPPDEDELRRVKRELKITRQERDILEKAVAIFSHPRR